jgi:GAF domain-containing protein
MAPADPAAREFETHVDATLQLSCELARALAGAHQAAMSLIVKGDWRHARKYFSLSEEYAAFRDFTMPARGIGLHALVVTENSALRLTQAEVERHPAWRGYAEARGAHPPLRGLLAVPIVGADGLNYGLLQSSDKANGGDFDDADERNLRRLADLASLTLDALGKVRGLRGGADVPTREREPLASFVQIESLQED